MSPPACASPANEEQLRSSSHHGLDGIVASLHSCRCSLKLALRRTTASSPPKEASVQDVGMGRANSQQSTVNRLNPRFWHRGTVHGPSSTSTRAPFFGTHGNPFDFWPKGQWSPCEEPGGPWSEKLQGPEEGQDVGEQGFNRRLDTVARQLARASCKVWIDIRPFMAKSLRV